MTISSFSLRMSVWAGLVQEHLEVASTSSHGHRCLYLKDDGTVAMFEKEVALAQGLHNALGVYKLIEITQDILKQSNDQCDLELGHGVLKLLNEHVKILINTPFTAGTLFEQTLGTPKINTGLISEEMSARLEVALNEVQSIIRSEVGQDGVYFLQGSQEKPQFLLKFRISDPFTTVVADKFYEKLGFITPNYVLLEKRSDLGQKVVDIFSKHFPDKKIWGSHITVMSYIKGTSLLTLPLQDKIKAFNDLEFLKSLGEILFYDTIIGNHDRINSFNCNLGNIMILPHGVSDTKGRKIALIDHDFLLTSRIYKSQKESVNDLISKKYSIVSALLRSIPEEKIDRNQIIAEMNLGIDRAKEEFLKVSNEEWENLLHIQNPDNKINLEPFLELCSFIRGIK